MKTLQGARVLVTRPRQQNRNQISLLREQGAEAIEFPLLRIETCTADASLLGQNWNAWIVTSANAARRLCALEPDTWPEQVFTLGRATNAALGSTGRNLVQVLSADGLTSESLLGDARLARVDGKRILICTGQGGRELIEPSLRQRGAIVKRLDLYRRIPETHDPRDLARCLGRANACIVTSGEGLNHLHANCPPPVRSSLLGWPLVVPSVRVIEIARGLGHRCIEAPHEMSDAALVNCLSLLWRRNSGEAARIPRTK